MPSKAKQKSEKARAKEEAPDKRVGRLLQPEGGAPKPQPKAEG